MASENIVHKQTEIQEPTTRWYRLKERLAPYPFIAPFFIGFLVFQLLPIAFSIYLSFAEWNGMGAIEFLGLKNFSAMVQDDKFWNALRVTFYITAFCTIGESGGSVGFHFEGFFLPAFGNLGGGDWLHLEAAL